MLTLKDAISLELGNMKYTLNADHLSESIRSKSLVKSTHRLLELTRELKQEAN